MCLYDGLSSYSQSYQDLDYFQNKFNQTNPLLDFFLHSNDSEIMTGSLFSIAKDAICALKYSEVLPQVHFCDKSNRCFFGKATDELFYTPATHKVVRYYCSL